MESGNARLVFAREFNLFCARLGRWEENPGACSSEGILGVDVYKESVDFGYSYGGEISEMQ